MSETHAIPEYHDESGYYVIRLKGQLNDRWADWLGEITITLEEDGNTLINLSGGRSGSIAWITKTRA